MAGIGFLGAGSIIKSGSDIRGVTTAATIWCVAAIGLAVGIGMYLHSLVATALVLFALFVVDRIEQRIETSVYKALEVVLPDEPGIVDTFAAKMTGARVLDIDLERRSDGTLRVTYTIRLLGHGHVLPFFDAVARQSEVRYIHLR